MNTVTTPPDRRAMRSMAGPSHDDSAGEPDAVHGCQFQVV
jgi:hypothetical protein